MKKISLKRTFALATSAIALTTAFVGCSDYSGVFTNEEIGFVERNQEYDDAFVKLFGTPDPTHDWGMGEIGVIQSITPKATRAYSSTVGTVWVNRNQWTERSSDHGHIKYNESALAHDIQIPGWPHLNQLYYGSGGEGVLRDGGTKLESEVLADNGFRPLGDITEYEIQYVSNWFRTHKNPESIELHLSDFFIQNVSCDNDQLTYDGYVTGNGVVSQKTGTNGVNVKRPSDMCPEAPQNGGQPTKGGNVIRYTNSDSEINYALDKLEFCDMDKQWTHVNNFNNQNSNFNPEEASVNPNREIQFVTSSGTENFRCRSSWTTYNESQGYHEYLDIKGKDWVLVHLTWQETVVNDKSPVKGQTFQREGYYLAFDFRGRKAETEVEQDGFFSNWIVKITPAHFNPESKNVRRVMCEDLGGSFDFDFNDVVFDVAFDGNGQSIISVQAAGGTMPISVEKNPEVGNNYDNYEIHNLLSSDGAMVPVNAVPGGRTSEVSIYRGNTHTVTGLTAKVGDLKVYVKNTKYGPDKDKWLSYSGNGNEHFNLEGDKYGDVGNDDWKTDVSMIAPRAFAVPLDVKPSVVDEDEEEIGKVIQTPWMQEYKCIHDSYYFFDEWVKNKNLTFGIGGVGGVGDRGWWEQVKKQDLLYVKSITTEADNPTGTTPTVPLIWNPLLLPNGSAPAFADYHLVIDREGQGDAYTGDDKILTNLTNDAVKQITFTIVLKSAYSTHESATDGGQEIQAILIPADIASNGGTTTLSYQGRDFLTYTSSETKDQVLAKAPFTQWHTAVQQWGYGDENGKDTNSKYTYTVRFTFTKEQLRSVVDGSGNITKFCDYLLLYLKDKKGDTITIPQLVGASGQVEWYIHY